MDWRGMLEDSTGALDPPIDLVHLASQCLGDHELQVELLSLFRRQAPVLTAQLCDSPPSSPESRARIAHTLRGSALAVGARRVATAAWRLEELAAGSSDRRSAEARAIASVQSAVDEALAEIDRIRG
jgi:HPt (histidine-containing phosphotransfer) domain-containing protein